MPTVLVNPFDVWVAIKVSEDGYPITAQFKFIRQELSGDGEVGVVDLYREECVVGDNDNLLIEFCHKVSVVINFNSFSLLSFLVRL